MLPFVPVRSGQPSLPSSSAQGNPWQCAPLYWPALPFPRVSRHRSHGSALGSYARLLGGAVGLSARRPRLHRLSRTYGRRPLPAPLASCPHLRTAAVRKAALASVLGVSVASGPPRRGSVSGGPPRLFRRHPRRLAAVGIAGNRRRVCRWPLLHCRVQVLHSCLLVLPPWTFVTCTHRSCPARRRLRQVRCPFCFAFAFSRTSAIIVSIPASCCSRRSTWVVQPHELSLFVSCAFYVLSHVRLISPCCLVPRIYHSSDHVCIISFAILRPFLGHYMPFFTPSSVLQRL